MVSLRKPAIPYQFSYRKLSTRRGALHRSGEFYSGSDSCGNLEPEGTEGEPNGEVPESELKNKYNPGGEGERHRKLKQFIADHPERLGLDRGEGTMEHRFVTGDSVDVSVDPANGEHCVVEIAIEGEPTLIGAHQALKYRALRAGELDATSRLMRVWWRTAFRDMSRTSVSATACWRWKSNRNNESR